MNMDAVAESDLGDDRRERRPAAVSPCDIAHHFAQNHRPVGAGKAKRGTAVYFVLRRPALRLEGFRLLTGLAQCGDDLRTEIDCQLMGDQGIVGARQVGQAVEIEFLFER